MARGNHGQAIYGDEQDRKLWLEALGEVCEKTEWRVHAYVIMGNHHHLLIETPEANLVAGMKWFQGAYRQRFNSRPREFGHLFQGRYVSPPQDGGREVEVGTDAGSHGWRNHHNFGMHRARQSQACLLTLSSAKNSVHVTMDTVRVRSRAARA